MQKHACNLYATIVVMVVVVAFVPTTVIVWLIHDTFQQQ